VAESVPYFNECLRASSACCSRTATVVGESSYNPMLERSGRGPGAKGLLSRTTGRCASSPPGSPTAEASRSPLIVRKVRRRLRLRRHRTWPAVRDAGVGPPRALRRIRLRSWARPRPSTSRWSSPWRAWRGWLPDDVEAVHVSFANVLGLHHKMLKEGAEERFHHQARGGCSTRRSSAAETAMAGGQVDPRPPAEPATCRRARHRRRQVRDLSTDRTRDTSSTGSGGCSPSTGTPRPNPAVRATPGSARSPALGDACRPVHPCRRAGAPTPSRAGPHRGPGSASPRPRRHARDLQPGPAVRRTLNDLATTFTLLLPRNHPRCCAPPTRPPRNSAAVPGPS